MKAGETKTYKVCTTQQALNSRMAWDRNSVTQLQLTFTNSLPYTGRGSTLDRLLQGTALMSSPSLPPPTVFRLER